MYSYNEKDTVGKLVSNFWKISRVLRDTYDGRGSQRRVLTVLLKSGDVITQSALTERLDIQPGSASEVLAKLEAAGLIQRTANDKDRRTINISLTEEGRVAAQEAYAKRDKVRHELMSNLNEGEQEQLLKLLESLRRTIPPAIPRKAGRTHNMKLVFKYIKRHWVSFLLSTMFLTLEAAADLLQPTFMSYIVDRGIKNADVDQILHYGLIMLCIAAVGAAGALMRNYFPCAPAKPLRLS